MTHSYYSTTAVGAIGYSKCTRSHVYVSFVLNVLRVVLSHAEITGVEKCK